MLKKAVGALFLLMCMLVSFASNCDNFPIDPINNYGHIMVTHASPDLANVDVHVSNIIVEDQSYRESIPYVMLEEGSHKVSLTPTGMDDILLETDVKLQAGEYYSVFACDAAANLTALVIKDEYPEPEADETLIRFVHLSADAPAVDVALEDGTKLFESIAFKGSTAFVALPSGVYNLIIRRAGTDEVFAELEGTVLLQKLAHTLWLRGFFNGSNAEELGGELIYNRVVL